MAEAGLSSGSRIAGRKVSIGDTTRGTANVVTLLKWQGPVHLIEGPTKAHPIVARRLAGSRRRKGSRGLAFNGVVRRGVQHPGTQGRRFWRNNVSSARRITTTVYKQAAFPAVLREVGLA